QHFFVLETADDDAGGDAEFGGEALDCLSRKEPFLAQLVKGRFRDQEVRGERVSFFLFAKGFLIMGAVFGFDEDISFAVFKNVSAFVEESEPEEVVFFTAKAELEDGFGRGEPTSGAVGAGGGKLGDEDQGDASGA